MPKNRLVMWLAIVIILGAAILWYQSSVASDRVNVEPHAAREIEKAKRR